MSTVLKPISSLLSIDPEKESFLTVFIEGQQRTIREDNPRFDAAVKAYRLEDWKLLDEIMTPRRVVTHVIEEVPGIEIKNNEVLFDDRVVSNTVVTRILKLLGAGYHVNPLIKFLKRLMQNPSYQAIHSLYQFMENGCMPITDEGTFIAYKSVRKDYLDHYTGKFRNKVGDEISLPRNECDDDRSKACSLGFHIGTYKYASEFNSAPHIMLVECDPSDVVSVPNDSKEGKLRTCKYKVIGELTDRKPLAVPIFQTKDALKYPAPIETVPAEVTSGITLEAALEVVSSATSVDNQTLPDTTPEDSSSIESVPVVSVSAPIILESVIEVQQESSDNSSVFELSLGDWALLRDKYEGDELKSQLKAVTSIGNSRVHRNYRKKEKLQLTIQGDLAIAQLQKGIDLINENFFTRPV